MKISTIIFKLSVIMSASLTLTSCSLFSPVKTDPGSAYLIKAMPCVFPAHKRHRVTLLVTMPETVSAYNTTQMAYSIKPYQIAYFSQNRWAETPGEMLHPLIAQTLQNTHQFRAVVTPPFMGRYDYELDTRIMTLEQDFTHIPTVLRLVVHAQIAKISLNRVTAVRDFCIEVPIHHGSPYNGVLAANRATTILLSELADFTIRNTR